MRSPMSAHPRLGCQMPRIRARRIAGESAGFAARERRCGERFTSGLSRPITGRTAPGEARIWVKMKNPTAPAVAREAEEEWR
jgi:hypothetical protein